MSASWDSDLSSIIEKTNNNLKLLRKIGDKPQVRAPDVSMTAPTLARSGSASGSVSSHSSARPRAYVGAQDDAGSVSSRSSARPRAFIRGDDDTSSMGSHGSARPKAYVRGDDDTGSMGSHTSARPRVYVGDDGTGSVSSHSSARPKAFIRADDDSGSVSSRASARPKAFIRADDDSGSVSSRASARPKAFIRADDDSGSVSSRASARPKAFVRGDDDTGSMSSNQGLGRSRLDSGHGSVASASGRPHVGIAGGGGLTAAMLQQHRAAAGGAGAMAMADLGAPRPRYDLDETRSMSGASSRLSRRLGADGRVPHARPLGASMGPRIRVPDSDIPSDVPKHVIEEVKKSLETHFASRNGAVDKKVADLRTDVAGLTTQTSSLASQISELRDAVLVSANSHPSANAPSVSDPKIIASVQANAAAIARLEEHSADLLGRKVSVDRELAELGSRVKALSSSTMKISTLEDNIEALVANRQKQEQGLFKLADRVQLMHRQMGSLVDMKAVENLLSIRLTREFREMEDRLAQNVMRMAEKMEQKVSSLEKQSFSQRQESLAALKNDLTDDIQRLQSSALRKSDLLPLQNAQTQSKEDLAQLSSVLDRQEKKLQDAKLASATLRDELADARTELNKALQSQQRSAAAMMEEKLEQIACSNKEKSNKFDDQLSELAKKQKKLEEATKNLQETMSQVKVEASQRMSRSSADREEENDKLRQRLARSVAELEALAATKAEVERRFASEEQQFQARLKELRSTLTETEKQKEAQRLELMQKLQEESKLMGVAQGKNSLLENLLAREKAENEEKNELVRKSKKEVAEVREQIHNLETEKEKKVRQLTSELQAKQTQVGLLTKTLKRIETASAKMLDLSKREAKTVRRVKATKEHELFIAQLKLKEMERVAQALQNGDEMKKQAALTAASTEERNELEKLLLESQLEKDELKQELEEMTEEFNAAKESQKVIMEDTITKLSSDYDEKIGELKQQIADKEQAMRQLRDTLVEKSNLDALEDELAALKDEKNDLLEQIQRAQIEHERVTLSTETNLRLEHATQFAAMKSKFEERISELEGAQSELETTKATITELEKELEKQEALHQREVSTLTHEIKEARSKIDEFTAQILELEETKTRLEGEVSQMEANIGGASAEKEEELAAIKGQMQAEVDRLRAELSEVSSTLEEKQTQLKEAKQSDETNRQKLVEMAMAQEEMQSRYVSQIDSLTLKLNQERESSRAREQDLEDTIDKLNADVKSLKAESNKELEAARSELTDQMTELTTTLKASQHREQQLQSRLKRILEELVQAANASGDNEVIEDSGDMSDDDAITHHLDALYATHRRTAHELERLQAEYELTVKQAAADSATAQELDSQVKEHETQIRELESVVEQLREELKEQYHKSAIIAKGSDEFSEEMMSLREEKRQLERQLQEEEKDRAKREVSYQRRTEMKEREVEELRTENKTLTAAVAAVREKIRAVENVKYHDLGELQSKLKDLEERTAALTPDENNVANLEKDFTATRQEIVTLTAEVQSLYQKLTACCGIMEWSELRASVFDEEEKLTRVRAENARELAKVQSVEQEVLMNAEFLNALLVAHGSGGDSNLLNDFRWMQKYASIAPEIVEKLRNVESRLRDAVLDLHDGSTSVFPDGIAKAPVSGVSIDDGAVPAAPSSQNSSVDGAAIALALEKAKEDYFVESEQGLDEENVKHDVDQPDVEQESPVDVEGEGASSDNVDVEGEDSVGDFSHDESGTDAELGVAEHVVRAEQERSREERAVAMSNLDGDEDSSDDVAEEDSFKGRQDRSDDDEADGDGVGGLESSVDCTIAETKATSRWSSVGFRGDGDSEDDDMDEVERLMLERSLAHSSKQVNPHIGNECDSSDEFAHDNDLDKTELQPAAVANDDGGGNELDEVSSDGSELKGDNLAASADLSTSREAADPREQSDAQQGASSEQEAVAEDELIDEALSDGSELEDGGLAAGTGMNTIPPAIAQPEQSDAELDASQDASSQQEEEDEHELDPLEESSFDSAMMAALEGNEPNVASFSQNVVHRSMRGDEVEEADKSDSDGFVVQDAVAESSFDDSTMSEGNEHEGMSSRSNLASDAGADHGSAAGKPTPVEHTAQLENSFDGGGDDLSDSEISVNERSLEKHHEGERALDESTASSVENLNNEGDALDEAASSSERGIASYSAANGDTLDGSAADQDGNDEVLEESASSADKCATEARYFEGSEAEVSASSVDIGAMADRYEQGEPLEESTPSVATDVGGGREAEDNALEESMSRLSEGGDVADDQLQENEDIAPGILSSSKARAVPVLSNDFDELDESASSLTSDAMADQLNQSSNALEELSTSVAMDDERPDNYEAPSSAARREQARQRYENNTMLEDSASSSVESGGAALDEGRDALEGSSSSVDNAAVADQLHESDELEESVGSVASQDGQDSVEAAAAVAVAIAPPPAPAPAMSVRMEDDGDSSEEEETMPVPSQPTFSSSLSRFGMGSRGLNLEEDDDLDQVERLLLEQRQSTKKTLPQLNRFTTGRTITTDEFGESSLQSQSGNGDEFGEASIQSNAEESGETFGESQQSRLGGLSSATTGSRNVGVSEVASMLSTLQDANEFSESSFKSQSTSEFGLVSIQSRRHGDDKFGQVSQGGDEFDDEDELAVQADALEDSCSSMDDDAVAGDPMMAEFGSSLERVSAHVDASSALEDSDSSVENAALANHVHEADALDESIGGTGPDGDASPSNPASGAFMGQPDEDDALERLASRLAGDGSVQPVISRHTFGSRYTYDAPQHDEDDGARYRNERVSPVAVSHADPLAESSFDEDVAWDLEHERSVNSGSTVQPTKQLDDGEGEGEWSEEQLRAAEHSLDSVMAKGDNDDASESGEEPGAAVAPPRATTMSLRMEEDGDSSEEEETMAVQSPPTFSSSLRRIGLGARRVNLEEDDDMDEVERLLLEQSRPTMKTQRLPQLSRITRPIATDDDEFGEASLESHEGELGDASRVRSRAPIASGADEDDEFGEASIRSISRGDDEFNETSIASRSPDSGEKSVRSRESSFGSEAGSAGLSKVGKSGVAAILSRLQDGDEFGEASLETNEFGQPSIHSRVLEDSSNDEFGQASQEEDEFGETSLPLRDDGAEHKAGTAAAPLRMARNDEFGGSPVRSRRATEFGEASIQSDGYDDEFAEASIRSLNEEDDEFGEISIPLHDDAPVGAQTPSRSLGAHTPDFAGRAVAYPEGVMSSPAKLTTTNANAMPTPAAIHEDSASEAENDYMDESFDLDESLEEEEDDNDERHV